MSAFVEAAHPRNRTPGARAGQFVVMARDEAALTLDPSGADVDPFADDPDVRPGDLLDALHAAGTSLMAEHGLTGWTLAYDTTRGATLGATNSSARVIVLSAPNMAAVSGADRLDTVRHEIAHALLPPQEGHGPNWQLKAMQLGARPTSASRVDADHAVRSAVVGTCPMGHVMGKGRMPAAQDLDRYFCNHHEHPGGQSRVERKVTWARNALDPEIAAAAARHPAPAVVRTVALHDRAAIAVAGHHLDGAAGTVIKAGRTRCTVRLDDGTLVTAPFSAVTRA